MIEPIEQEAPPITELSKGQRRVLGTLLEKAFTTPEAYPLTVKALTTGCNQKSNRHPMTEYSEDDVLEIIDELREMGLVAVLHTESGRTERYRHYVRKRFPWSEPQLAIMTELLLRGRQSVGDLRARASRMVPIENLDDLREALRGLLEQNRLQANGPLDRRGVEIDHNLYSPAENKRLGPGAPLAGESETEMAPRGTRLPESPRPTAGPAAPAPSPAPVDSASFRQLADENRELRSRVDALESDVRRLAATVDELVRDLRG